MITKKFLAAMLTFSLSGSAWAANRGRVIPTGPMRLGAAMNTRNLSPKLPALQIHSLNSLMLRKALIAPVSRPAPALAPSQSLEIAAQQPGSKKQQAQEGEQTSALLKNVSKRTPEKIFDNSIADKKAPQEVPVDWVEKMIDGGSADTNQAARLQDVVQRTGFTQVALNRQVIESHNAKYTHELAMGPMTNQQSSGRCWIFAGLNMVRESLIASGKVPADFQFSENYMHFFNMLEKSNSYLERVIEKARKQGTKAKLSRDEFRQAVSPGMGDGGFFEWFEFLVAKYGLVPKAAMGETISSNATATLISELNNQLASAAGEMLDAARRAKPAEMLEIKQRAMARTWKILATHLSAPPARFEYRSSGKTVAKKGSQVTPAKIKEFTPRQFAEKFAQFDPRDYVVVASYPRRKAGVYEVRKSGIGATEPGSPKFNLRFMNLGADRLEELTLASIKGGQTMWFGADALKDIDYKTGIMHPKIYDRDAVYNFSLGEKGKKLTRKEAVYFGVNQLNHAMVITGFDQPDKNGPAVKFKVENSWGDALGSGGIFHMYRDWFKENVYQIIVHKKFLDQTERKAWNGKAKQIRDADML